MNKIPTAEKFFKLSEDWGNAGKQVHQKMIEFAKLHVEAALKASSEKYWETATTGSNSIQGYHNDIVNAYPLENIK
jgi:hypothetical protein